MVLDDSSFELIFFYYYKKWRKNNKIKDKCKPEGQAIAEFEIKLDEWFTHFNGLQDNDSFRIIFEKTVLN